MSKEYGGLSTHSDVVPARLIGKEHYIFLIKLVLFVWLQGGCVAVLWKEAVVPVSHIVVQRTSGLEAFCTVLVVYVVLGSCLGGRRAPSENEEIQDEPEHQSFQSGLELVLFRFRPNETWVKDIFFFGSKVLLDKR